MSVVVLQNHEDEKNSSEFFAVAGAPLTYQYRWCGSICFDYEIFLEGNATQLFARFSSGASYAGFGKEQKSWGYGRSSPESSHFHTVKINFPKKMDKITVQSLKLIASRPEGIRQADLWKLLNINHRTCSKVVRKLAAGGFIRRREVNIDGIIKTYLLTPVLPVNFKQFRTIHPASRDVTGSPDLEELVRNHQIVVKGRIVKSVDDLGTGPYRILTRPLREILIDDLKKGSCSFRDLADRHTLSQEDIRHEIKSLIRSEHLPEQGYVIGRSGHRRRTKTQGSEYVYSLIPVPVKARIFDPFLGFSLLDWTRFLALPGNEPHLVPVHEVMAAYRDLVHAVSGIPYTTIEAHLSRSSCIFIGSTFGPVPVLTRSAAYLEIFSSLTGGDELALQVPLSDAEMERKIREIEAFIRHGPGNLSEIQQYVLALSDMLRSCGKDERRQYLDRLEFLNEQFFRKLFHSDSPVPGQTRDSRPVELTEPALPVTIQGSGDRDILFEAQSGTIVISGEYAGEGRFFLLRRTRITTSLIHATPAPDSFSEMISTKKGRVCSLAIRANGAWSLRLSSPSLETAKTLPFRILGQNRQVTEPFILTAGKKVFSVNHYGSGRIVITLNNSEGPAIIPVLDSKGPQEISQMIQNDRLCIGWLDVYAHGNWRITIENEQRANPEG